MLNQPPNWVAERAKCRVDLLFEALCQVVERDVAEVNKLPSNLRGGFTFSVERNDDGMNSLLRVYRSTEGDSASTAQAVATFTQLGTGIHVLIAGKEAFMALPEWVDQPRSCLLSIDGTRYQVWELSQRILGPVFFER